MSIASKVHSLGEGVLIALDAIRTNKARAALTILGIAVGVFVVTAMAAGVHGINEGVSKSLEAAGPTTFYVTRWPMGAEQLQRLGGQLPVAAPQAAHDQRSGDDLFAAVDSRRDRARWERRAGEVPRQESPVRECGRVHGRVDGGRRRGHLEPGRSFTDNENSNADQVIIVNDKMKEALFDQSDAVGKIVAVDGKPFTVIGALSSAGEFLQQQRQARRDHPVRDGASQAAVRRAVDGSHRQAEGRRRAGCRDGRSDRDAAHASAPASVGRGHVVLVRAGQGDGALQQHRADLLHRGARAVGDRTARRRRGRRSRS